MAKTNPSIYY